jgi:hypothetical protein
MSSVRWWTVRESRTRAVMLKRSSRLRGSFSSSPACHTQVDNGFFQAVLRDPECSSRVLIFYPSWIPDFRSPISDTRTITKRGGGRKFCCLTFFEAKNFTKMKITLFKWNGKKFEPLTLPVQSQKYGLGIRIRNPDLRISIPSQSVSTGSTLMYFIYSNVQKFVDYQDITNVCIYADPLSNFQRALLIRFARIV